MRRKKKLDIVVVDCYNVYESMSEPLRFFCDSMQDPAREIDLMGAGVHPAMVRAFSESTLQAYAVMWAQNLRANIRRICEPGAKSIVDMSVADGTRDVLVMGGGASMWQNLGFVDRFRGVKICCLRQLPGILKAGVVPDYAVCVDGNELYAAAACEAAELAGIERVKGVFNTMVHSHVVNSWRGEIYWFNAAVSVHTPSPTEPDFWLGVMTGKPVMSTGGCAGSAAWLLAYNMRVARIVCIGLDYAEPYGEGEFVRRSSGVGDVGPPRFLRWEENPFKQRVMTDLGYQSLRDALLMMQRSLYESDVSRTSGNRDIRESGREKSGGVGGSYPTLTVQCSRYTIWHTSPGIELQEFEDYLNEHENGTGVHDVVLTKAAVASV